MSVWAANPAGMPAAGAHVSGDGEPVCRYPPDTVFEHPTSTRGKAPVSTYVLATESTHSDPARPQVTCDAEVFQEILHRYSAINRPDALADAYAILTGLVDEVFPIGPPEVAAAKALVLEGVGSRAAIHAATMRAHGITRILSFDRGFDRFADLVRMA